MPTEDAQKKIKKTRNIAYVAYALMGASVLITFQKIAKTEGPLSPLDIAPELLFIFLDPIFIAGVVALIYALIKFRKFKKEKVIDSIPKLPIVLLGISLGLLLVFIVFFAVSVGPHV